MPPHPAPASDRPSPDPSADALPLDPARLRANFPAFAEPSLQGHFFFQNAGGSYMARQVIGRLTEFYPRTGGSFYSQRTLEGAGIDPAHGILRLSFVHYTTPAEVTRLIAALDAEL